MPDPEKKLSSSLPSSRREKQSPAEDFLNPGDRPAALMRRLEPRLLFDAAALVTVVDTAMEPLPVEMNTPGPTSKIASGDDEEAGVAAGTIEAKVRLAPAWNGPSAPLTISTTAQPDIAHPNPIPVGGAVIWENAGSIGGTSIDLVATLTSMTGGTSSVTALTSGDDPSLALFTDATGGGDAVIVWEIFQSGTDQNITAVGSPSFTITDIDGTGTENTLETVRPSLFGLQSFTVDTNSALTTIVAGGSVQATGTTSDGDNIPTGTNSLGPGRDGAAITFDWVDVSSWTVTYTSESANQGRVFSHDGDGDFVFTTPNVTNLLGLDLNASESGTGFGATFTENGSAVPIVDTDVKIDQNVALGNQVHLANIVLANANSGDQFLVAGSADQAGQIEGLDYSITSENGQISIALSGAASLADYQAALKSITFENTTEDPNPANRLISISVTNSTYGTTTNVALTTVRIQPLNDVPVVIDVTPEPQHNISTVDPMYLGAFERGETVKRDNDDQANESLNIEFVRNAVGKGVNLERHSGDVSLRAMHIFTFADTEQSNEAFGVVLEPLVESPFGHDLKALDLDEAHEEMPADDKRAAASDSKPGFTRILQEVRRSFDVDVQDLTADLMDVPDLEDAA